MENLLSHFIGDIILIETNNSILLEGPVGSIAINKGDKIGLKVAMLFENQCLGTQATQAAIKYGFSRPCFYQIKNNFKNGGTEALREKKKGPSKNYKRTDTIVNQILRMRFLDPDASTAVITQKLKQLGFEISQRSVERTITEYGIQKKTLFVKPGKEIKRSGGSSNKT
jgi:transposase